MSVCTWLFGDGSLSPLKQTRFQVLYKGELPSLGPGALAVPIGETEAQEGVAYPCLGQTCFPCTRAGARVRVVLSFLPPPCPALDPCLSPGEHRPGWTCRGLGLILPGALHPPTSKQEAGL